MLLRTLLRTATGTALFLFTFAAAAEAASTGYGSAQGVTPAKAAGQGQLPFTGLHIAPVLAGGLILLVLGLLLTRSSHKQAGR